jgi:alanine-synthesizing transaminase
MAPRPAWSSSKLAEAARNARDHRYSASRGIPGLRVEIARRYQKNYGVDLDTDPARPSF